MQTFHPKFCYLLLSFVCFPFFSFGQSNTDLSLLEPADSFHSTRFWTCAIGGGLVYSGFSIALYESWYKDYELVPFHTFDDLGEWRNMDKMGHFFTAAMESRLSFGGAMWTGMDRRKAMWTGAGVGFLLQTTVEVMDGFSEKWGFSWADVGFNTLGVGFFVGQEIAWQEQRITLKVSHTRPNYNNEPVPSANGLAFSSPQQRANELYGTGFFETFLKDYNGMTIWASFNLHSFLPPNKQTGHFPKWLNLAIGYGVDGLYGGYGNTWTDEAGNAFTLAEDAFPRSTQFYLSLDIDLTRIPTKHRWLKTAFNALHWIKIPAPTLEINTLGKVRGYGMYW
ncbi:MAG: DUF2279 domain-containing protein [Saprospiraceae bacterium]